MNSSYPIMLQLEGKKVVVVGGGKVAERKVNGLLGTGALVSVISPIVTDELRRLSGKGVIDWKEKLFSPDDMKDSFLIFAATNDRELNQFIRNSAGVHQLVTIADDPDESDFHVPAHFHRGKLSIAVSTGGASPTLASTIRAELEQQFDERYEEYLEFLYNARQQILKEVADPVIKRKLLKAIVTAEFLNSNQREVDLQQLLDVWKAGI
jgi:precorrin-2 dehydrogenase / sirohydrochlorin ferrochelatase